MSTPPAIRSLPATYAAGERAEYDAIRNGCAIDRIVPRALIEVQGPDAVARVLRGFRFRLHDPGPGDVRAAVLLADGLLTATATVVRLDAERLVVDCSNPTAQRVLSAGGSEVRRETGPQPLVRLRLRGPALAQVIGPPPAPGTFGTDLAPGGAAVLLCGTAPGRATIYVRRNQARACWDALVGVGAVPVGSTALETVRIEDGEPCLERDFRQPLPLAAAGLAEFGHGDQARVLVALEHEGQLALDHGRLLRDGAEVGELRVGARSPLRAGRPVALGLIDRALAAPGALIDVDAGERVLAGVVTRRAALPVGSAAPNY